MDTLFEILKAKTFEWKKNHYKSKYSAIQEILEWQIVNGKKGSSMLRYLRQAQLEALEVYWYLRTQENTSHIFDLHKKYFQKTQLLESLGIPTNHSEITELLMDGGIDNIFKKIEKDDDFVRKYGLNAVRETINLDYPSYILALAMGAGKTVLIGAILATEFAMALEYPDGKFIKNALIFAPGKTILGALKELSDVPYDKILPPRLYKQFVSTVKITYTRDGQKDIPVIQQSSFNVVVTNTEKIRITKQSINKGLLGKLSISANNGEDEIKQDVANQRLRTIASLPNLGIFSDEAHHTYGQALDKELKQVRKTVDYLAKNTDVIVVVNTTGTPYYKRQLLKDVIYWYGLSQGIRDGILKEVKGNIEAFEEVQEKDFVREVLKDFFKHYEDVKIYNNTSAKIAMYFSNTDDLESMRSIVDKTLTGLGLDTSIVLAVTNKSDDKTKDLFNNRINDPANPYRVFLLVNMGTEGWNVPSLFATALAREIRSSNNFVLQAASRCLRQVPNNEHKAKIYLSHGNVNILDSELQETFGETLSDLNATQPEIKKATLTIRKMNIPPITLQKTITKFIRSGASKNVKIAIKKPKDAQRKTKITRFTMQQFGLRSHVLSEEEEREIILEDESTDARELAVDMSQTYRLPFNALYDELHKHYGDDVISEQSAHDIRQQVEAKARKYKKVKQVIETALALIRQEGFDKEGSSYVTEIQYRKDREKLLSNYEVWHKKHNIQKSMDFGFHYSPYNFDSEPESDFFDKMLFAINEHPKNVEDIYFTGAMDDPKKTDFLFEYQAKDGLWHNYAPDFLIRLKSGKMIIVEVKGEDRIDAGKTIRKAKAMKEIEGLNPAKLKYEIVQAKGDSVSFGELDRVKKMVVK